MSTIAGEQSCPTMSLNTAVWYLRGIYPVLIALVFMVAVLATTIVMAGVVAPEMIERINAQIGKELPGNAFGRVVWSLTVVRVFKHLAVCLAQWSVLLFFGWNLCRTQHKVFFPGRLLAITIAGRTVTALGLLVLYAPLVYFLHTIFVPLSPAILYRSFGLEPGSRWYYILDCFDIFLVIEMVILAHLLKRNFRWQPSYAWMAGFVSTIGLRLLIVPFTT